MRGVIFYTIPARRPFASIERQVDHRVVMVRQAGTEGSDALWSKPLPEMEARILAGMYAGQSAREIVACRIHGCHDAMDSATDADFPVIY